MTGSKAGRPAFLPDCRPPRGGKGFHLNKTNTAIAPAAAAPRKREEAVKRPTKNWKPDPCLLTRRELKAIIARQLG
jgi:hypothetical protein